MTRTAVRASDGAQLTDRCVYRASADDDLADRIHDIDGHTAVVLIRVEGDDIVDHHAAAIKAGEVQMRGVVLEDGVLVERDVAVPLLQHPARIDQWPVRDGVTLAGVAS